MLSTSASSFLSDWDLDQPKPEQDVEEPSKLLAATVAPSVGWRAAGFKVLNLDGNTSCRLSNHW